MSIGDPVTTTSLAVGSKQKTRVHKSALESEINGLGKCLSNQIATVLVSAKGFLNNPINVNITWEVTFFKIKGLFSASFSIYKRQVNMRPIGRSCWWQYRRDSNSVSLVSEATALSTVQQILNYFWYPFIKVKFHLTMASQSDPIWQNFTNLAKFTIFKGWFIIWHVY